MEKTSKETENRHREFQELKREIEYLQEQFMLLEQRLVELNNMKESLNEINAEKIFTAIGSDMFLEGEIKNKEKVLINIGADIFVKKDTNAAKDIVNKQIGLTVDVMDKINSDLRTRISEIRFIQEELKDAQ